MKNSNLIFAIIAATLNFTKPTQGAILVGPTGTGTNTFDTAPAATEWSTLAVGTSAATYDTDICPLDANIKTTEASTVTDTLPTTSVVPPELLGTAQWNSTGFYLQTRRRKSITLF